MTHGMCLTAFPPIPDHQEVMPLSPSRFHLHPLVLASDRKTPKLADSPDRDSPKKVNQWSHHNPSSASDCSLTTSNTNPSLSWFPRVLSRLSVFHHTQLFCMVLFHHFVMVLHTRLASPVYSNAYSTRDNKAAWCQLKKKR